MVSISRAALKEPGPKVHLIRSVTMGGENVDFERPFS